MVAATGDQAGGSVEPKGITGMTVPYTDPSMSSVHTAAQAYLARGWALVALHDMSAGTCSCGGQRADPHHDRKLGGKHPRFPEWQRAPIRSATQLQPQWNVGIATGAPSGIWVLDFDPENAEYDGHALALRIGREIGPATVRTGGGGGHWYLKLPPGVKITNSRGALPRGWDVRGDGGQVVAPPSRSGKGAYLAPAGALAVYEPAGWLVELVRPPAPAARVEAQPVPLPQQAPVAGDRGQRYAHAAVADILDALSDAAEGTRDQVAFTAACRLHELVNAPWSRLDADQIQREYMHSCSLASLNGLSPFTEAEAAKCWFNAERRVAGAQAILPPDELAGEAMPPLPPGLPALAFTPWQASSDLVNVVDAMAVPLDVFEQNVMRELARMRERDEARRRLEIEKFGDRAAVLTRLRAELLSAEQIKARPRLVPLVDGLLYRNTLARINGASGHGKTFVTLDLAGRVAAGMPWAGRRTHAGRVVYMVAEGTEGIADRIEAWEAHCGQAMDVIFLPRPVQMLGPEWSLYVELMTEDPPVLCVLDTQARVTAGVDEIDRAEQSRVVEAADQLRDATGACVLLVHHRGLKGDHGRGHTEIKGALQTELGCKKEGGVITVDNGKSKDDVEMEAVIFDLTTVTISGMPDEYGVVNAPRAGAVAVWRDLSAIAILEQNAHEGEPLENVRARALWALIQQDYNPGDGGTEAAIRTSFHALPIITGISKPAAHKAWRRAWNTLVQRGLIVKMWNLRRFKVMILEKTGQDGVLTPNDGEWAQDAPDGWEVYRHGQDDQQDNAG